MHRSVQPPLSHAGGRDWIQGSSKITGTVLSLILTSAIKSAMATTFCSPSDKTIDGLWLLGSVRRLSGWPSRPTNSNLRSGTRSASHSPRKMCSKCSLINCLLASLASPVMRRRTFEIACLSFLSFSARLAEATNSFISLQFSTNVRRACSSQSFVSFMVSSRLELCCCNSVIVFLSPDSQMSQLFFIADALAGMFSSLGDPSVNRFPRFRPEP